MRIAKRLTFLTLKAISATVSEIHEIYDRAEAMEEFVKTNFKETIFGRSTKVFIASWNYHMLTIHIPEFVAMWGVMGSLDEESIEKLHQQCKEIMRVICNLKGEQKMMTLVKRQRMFNIP